MAIQRSIRRKLVLRIVFLLSGLTLISCGNGKTDETSMQPEESPLTGEVLYMNHCASCHGSDGKLGVSGASDLSTSKMDLPKIQEILLKGRKSMPVMKEILGSDENIESVSNYVIELRK